MAEEQRLIAGRYRLGDLIGRGGMAEVYRGTDTRLGRTVAVKLLKPELASDATFRGRFRQEAQAASRMSHPTIVRVFDAGEDELTADGGQTRIQPYIVMEYVEGNPLDVLIAAGPLAPERAVEITSGILTALEYSHRAGIVHRDIKPANVMIGKNGSVKVMDFGIARAVSDTSSSLAQTTAILGTAAYFSPEQAKGETVDARTDLYSTGIVLFEMLTGRVPFRGDTAVAVAYQHVSEPPADPSTLNPAVSPALDLVVTHALSKNRYDRYQTVSEFRADLELAGEGKVPVRSSGEDAATALFGPAPTVQSSTEQALRQLTTDTGAVRTQSRPPVAWIWPGVSVVAVVLVAVLIWVVSLPSSPGPAVSSRVVPDVTGLTLDEATAALAEQDLVAEPTEEESNDVEEGLVIRSFPAAGLRTDPNETVQVYVSSGTAKVSVPDVTEMSIDDATAELEDAGLEVGSTDASNSATIPEGTVTGTSPAQGKAVEPGSTVDLTVSNGKVALPDMTGQTLGAATDSLQGTSMGLTVVPVPDQSCAAEPNSPVTGQSIPPGDIDQGSEVELYYCAGGGSTPAPDDDEG
ncbi:Stk1 family PASTA domain-containing Ser/Thr kinase [Mycetocola reblochoni]|uniref:non-specific serine/threonine protein kinase n=1 Tax=Mycetocola reblochoni REB411 TaxID=1255698 RepID=A0A1R4JGF8_9MICO|nr:Stk1 family PASTA domain-containing Ser/Thr kinase [Mycetocola reblochoni]SJN30885.1 Serine/threonine protein kinase PrkC, regulator of stationary phase [Mycetocola reblochoni REB411]